MVIERVVFETRDLMNFSTNSSSSEDGGGAAGWTIDDNIHYFSTAWRSPDTAQVLQIEIRGVDTARPSAPRNLSARVASSTQIDLAWDAPTNQGASAITGYEVEVSTDSGSTWSDLAADTGDTDTDFEHTGLSSGNTRHYRVSAINTQGRGLLSDVAATTIAVPTAPRSVKATAGNRQVTLVWDTPSDNRVNSISKYQTRHKKGAGRTRQNASQIDADRSKSPAVPMVSPSLRSLPLTPTSSGSASTDFQPSTTRS